jgi:hypothetical protein
MNIEQETETYKEYYFKGEIDLHKISDYLEDYQKYVDETIGILTNELINDRKMYEKLLNFPFKKNRELIITKSGDIELDNYVKYLKENGVRIGTTEGGLYLFFDPLYFVNNFKKALPDIVIEYYIILNEDIEEGYEEDAGLIVPWDTLRGKIIRYENYLRKHSNIEDDCFFTKRLAKKKIDEYLYAYLYGLPNGPSLSYNNKEGFLNSEAKESFENFIEENKDSKYHQIVYVFYSKIKTNRFHVDEDALRIDPEMNRYLKESRTYY